jgi:hypothetical protein
MPSSSLHLPDKLLTEIQRWAEADGKSVEEWMVAALDRESLRRGLLVHSEWVKDNPIYHEDRWLAMRREIDAAERAALHCEAA